MTEPKLRSFIWEDPCWAQLTDDDGNIVEMAWVRPGTAMDEGGHIVEIFETVDLYGRGRHDVN